ncbi:24523_t:CDS:1, partial [Racocetra persica]
SVFNLEYPDNLVNVDFDRNESGLKIVLIIKSRFFNTTRVRDTDIIIYFAA